MAKLRRDGMTLRSISSTKTARSIDISHEGVAKALKARLELTDGWNTHPC
jgi:hypothetical protein